MEESQYNNQQDLSDVSSMDSSELYKDWWSLTESTESTMSDDRVNLSESSFEEHLSPEYYSCTKEESESIIESLNQMLENSNTNSAMGDVMASFGFW